MIKIWIDDVREAPDDWLWCQNSAEALRFLDILKYRGVPVDVISFDHDLGYDEDGNDDSTRPVAMWMAENEFWPKEIRLHTMNPVGYEYLQGFFNRYAPDHVVLEWNE